MDKVTYVFLTLMAKIRSIMSDIADIRKSSAAGAPTKVTKASEMTDTDKNYLYLGTESGYNSGHIYYFVEGVLTDGGAYGGVNVDTTLTQSGQAADAKVTGDEIATIKEDLPEKFRGEAMVTASSLDNFDSAVINRYYSVNGTGITNQPVAEKGHLLYFGLEGGSTTVKSGRELQFFITHKNDFYFRGNRFSTTAPWNDWAKLAKITDIPTEPLASLSMFESIGIIGDSYASGEIYNASAHADYYSLSWGQILARMCGCSAVNYSKGGLTTKSWLSDTTYGLAKLNEETANNLYIVALGINDANHSDTIPVGTIDDIESDSIESFYSYYGRIIRAIKAHAPNAIIILSTLARFTSAYTPYSNAIKAIGEHYSIAVLDLTTSDYFNSSFFTSNQISSHPTAVNYSGMAKAYKRLIETALEENAESYKSYRG